MFAYDSVFFNESREQADETLEMWRYALERRGIKVSRTKTKYMWKKEDSRSKHLGSTVKSNGECGKKVKNRVQAGWSGWKKE